MYVSESIPVKQLNSQNDSETLFLEINFRLRKWLIVGAYKSPDQSESVFSESFSESLSIYLDTHENVKLLGDFSMTPEDKNLQLFADSFHLEHLIKKPPTSINLIITGRKAYFNKTCILEAGISDFHKLTAVNLKSQILKAPPKRKLYRDYEVFDENSFNNGLKTKLDSIEILDYSSFEDIFSNVLNTHAPVKTKTIRVNNHEFMTQALRKASMTRSGLKNVYLRNQNTSN